ncbi:VapC toxin family PIN domain ribonuclease [Caulobacter radicis]|uniref:type II toxin-antitoxin system VapC family toxin n=1 Tax=Caulobacter radicis TaxID=2172650 RepID=UPI000D588896|nr:type II toxin-antitoxin system VapC family toxin [Caulobacter radicis]PVM90851.1 VapC toxin family PIN domain ribonuclease [Caulobacter radicis]
MFLLDTNAICEPFKDRGDAAVLSWIRACPPDHVFVSSVTIAEISYGLERVSPSRKADRIRIWRDQLIVDLADRLLPVDVEVAKAHARIRRAAENARRTMPSIDAFLAATAQVHGLTLVTRNVRDFEAWGGPVLDPWSG